MPKQISRAFKNLQSLVLQACGTNELAVLKKCVHRPSYCTNSVQRRATEHGNRKTEICQSPSTRSDFRLSHSSVWQIRVTMQCKPEKEKKRGDLNFSPEGMLSVRMLAWLSRCAFKPSKQNLKLLLRWFNMPFVCHPLNVNWVRWAPFKALILEHNSQHWYAKQRQLVETAQSMPPRQFCTLFLKTAPSDNSFNWTDIQLGVNDTACANDHNNNGWQWGRVPRISLGSTIKNCHAGNQEWITGH